MSGVKISQLDEASIANSTDQLAVNQNGVTRSLTISQIGSGGLVSIPNGTAPAPGLPLSNSATTGFYRVSSNVMGVAAAGAESARFSTAGVGIAISGSSSAPSVVIGSSGLGFYKGTAFRPNDVAETAIGVGTIGTQGDGSHGTGPLLIDNAGSFLWGDTKKWFGSGNPIIIMSKHNGVAGGAKMGLSVAQWNGAGGMPFSSEPQLLTYGSRGTNIGDQGAVATGDVILTIQACADDGVHSPDTYNICAQLDIAIDGTVASGVLPGRWQFKNSDSAGSFYTAFDLRASKAALLRTDGQLFSLYNGVTPSTNSILISEINFQGLNRSGASVSPTWIRGYHVNTVAGVPSGRLEIWTIVYNGGAGVNTRMGLLDGDNNTVAFDALTTTTTGNFVAKSGTAVGAGVATQAFVKASSTANLGVFYGTGDPSFSAAKGSLYSKTDATTAVTRLWVNTDGSTTWAFFTASA